MKPTALKTPRPMVGDDVVRSVIEYLDSATDYEEYLPAQQTTPATFRCESRRPSWRVGDFLLGFSLTFVPLLIIGLSLAAAFH